MSNVIPFERPVDMPEFFEIVLIDNFSEKGNPKKWVHPEMEELFAEAEKENEFVDGPFYRFWLTDDIHAVAVMDQKFFDSICDWEAEFNRLEEERGLLNSRSGASDYWNHEAIGMMHEIVILNLTEDWWSPGGEQFCFSEFGQSIPYPISVRMSSPDVCIHRDGDTWGWSS